MTLCFQLEDLEITLSDQMRGSSSRGIDFGVTWDAAVARDFRVDEETFALGASVNTLPDAVQSLVNFLGLEAAERSDKVPSGAVGHTLLLAGNFRGNKEVYGRARLALAEGQVTMHLTVCSQDAEVAELILSSVG